MELFYAVVFACISGVCEYHVVSDAVPISHCVEIARKKQTEYRVYDSFALASCISQTEYE